MVEIVCWLRSGISLPASLSFAAVAGDDVDE